MSTFSKKGVSAAFRCLAVLVSLSLVLATPLFQVSKAVAYAAPDADAASLVSSPESEGAQLAAASDGEVHTYGISVTAEGVYSGSYSSDCTVLAQKSAAAQQIYDAIVAAIESYQTTTTITVVSSDLQADLQQITEQDLSNLILTPEYFYLAKHQSFRYDWRTNGTTNTLIIAGIAYIDDPANIPAMREQVTKMAKTAASWASPSMTNVEKVQAVFDYLATSVHYTDEGDNRAHQYDMYGALVEKNSVCQGYALAMKYVLGLIGIDCIIVVSHEDVNHAWNMVNVDGTWYHFDVTWDSNFYESEGYMDYEYFLKSDATFSQDGHMGDNNDLKWKETGHTAPMDYVPATEYETHTAPAADGYFTENMFPGVIKGDMNFDGSLSIVDAQVLYDFCNGKYASDPNFEKMRYAADYNGDGNVEASDARAVQTKVLAA